MKLGYQNNLAEKENQLQAMLEMHKDDPKITEFVSKALALNDQLLQQQEVLCQRISQWSSHCEMSDKLTSQIVDLRLNYDLIDKIISNYLIW